MRKLKLEQSQKIVTVKYEKKNCPSTKLNTRIVSSRLRDSRVRKRGHTNKRRGDWGEDWRRSSLPLSPFFPHPPSPPPPAPPRTAPHCPLSHIKRSYFRLPSLNALSVLSESLEQANFRVALKVFKLAHSTAILHPRSFSFYGLVHNH